MGNPEGNAFPKSILNKKEVNELLDAIPTTTVKVKFNISDSIMADENFKILHAKADFNGRTITSCRGYEWVFDFAEHWALKKAKKEIIKELEALTDCKVEVV